MFLNIFVVAAQRGDFYRYMERKLPALAQIPHHVTTFVIIQYLFFFFFACFSICSANTLIEAVLGCHLNLNYGGKVFADR